ncbi:MAG TPA: glycosyltransferase, partial [Bacteroidota bacterium]
LVSLRSLRYGNMLKPSSRIVTRWICRNATFLTVLTHFQRQQLAQWDIERPDSIVIPYGTPASQFPFSRKEIQQRPIRLLHIGNLNPVKDQITLLRAFALIAHQVDARLRIVGEDHMDGALQEKARSLNIEDKIEFYGYVQYRELPAHYSWAHFLLHSSLHEAQAVVISEALSSGVVVVGTNVGLIADLDGRGTTAVPVGDYSGLAAKVLQFLEKPESYLEQAELGKAWADKHDIAWTVNEFSELYQRLSADMHAPAGFQPLRDSLDPRKVSSELTKEVLTRDRS